MLYKDILVELAKYTREKNLIEEDGWKKLKQFTIEIKLTERLVKQTKLKSFCVSLRYKYAIQIPKNFKDAQKLDAQNDNMKWMDLTKLEHYQLDNYYDIFIDIKKICKFQDTKRI